MKTEEIDGEDFDGCCFTEGYWTWESLGNEAWLTGCPCCGDNCWENIKDLENNV